MRYAILTHIRSTCLILQ